MEPAHVDEDESDEEELFAEVEVATRGDALIAINQLDGEFSDYVQQHGVMPALNFVNPRHAELVDGAVRLRNDIMTTRDYYVDTQRDGYLRVLVILDAARTLLMQGTKATLRETYYHLAPQHPQLFPNQRTLNDAVQDAAALLRATRASLGFTCSSRGLVSGCMYVKEPRGAMTDCRRQTYAIPGDPELIANTFINAQHATHVLVVEKDAVFQRLTEDRLFNHLPCILVTAKGMPDFATRIFLHQLCERSPHLVVVGLADWNPSGVSILLTYKFGSPRLDAHRSAVPRLRWLGVRYSDVATADNPSAHQPFTARDQTVLNGLRKRVAQMDLAQYTLELQAMDEQKVKVEIEGLYSLDDAAPLSLRLKNKILQGDYL